MKKEKLKKSKEAQDFFLVSAVIPSVNGLWSKLLAFDSEEYLKIKKASDANDVKRRKGEGVDCFILMCDSNIYHEVLMTGTMSLSKSQFDKLLKEKYNESYGIGRGKKPLKNVE